jgi:hypothetical protein
MTYVNYPANWLAYSWTFNNWVGTYEMTSALMRLG